MSRVAVDAAVLGAVRNFYAAGINYRAHIEWANSRGGSHKVPQQADVGYRSPSALIASGVDIVIPADATGPVEQKSDRTLWRAKNTDTFKPMGPFIVSGIDPMDQTIEVRINGRCVSSYSTRGMIHGVAHYLARMSRYCTLYPGDVVWFGCDGATTPALQPGDLVEVANDAIGVLANRVRRAG
jgi:2-keto-4-pentenoate hydratase/2-oxohepta-3-ene-1,7-dioic acid hydratase in catechol pathway